MVAHLPHLQKILKKNIIRKSKKLRRIISSLNRKSCKLILHMIFSRKNYVGQGVLSNMGKRLIVYVPVLWGKKKRTDSSILNKFDKPVLDFPPILFIAVANAVWASNDIDP